MLACLGVLCRLACVLFYMDVRLWFVVWCCVLLFSGVSVCIGVYLVCDSVCHSVVLCVLVISVVGCSRVLWLSFVGYPPWLSCVLVWFAVVRWVRWCVYVVPCVC